MNNLSTFNTRQPYSIVSKVDSYSNYIAQNTLSPDEQYQNKRLIVPFSLPQSFSEILIWKYLCKKNVLALNSHFSHTLHEEDYEHPLPLPYVYIETVKEELETNVQKSKKIIR